MQLYRFSPIQTYEELVKAVQYIHAEALRLSKASFGDYLPVAGTVAVFTHSEQEFAFLKDLVSTITSPDDTFNGKYFRLLTPITVPENDGVPSGTYTHIHVRRPDSYRAQVGDIDLHLTPEQYAERKQGVSEGKISGARVFPESRLDMIELYDFDSDVLAYADTFRLDDKTTWSTNTVGANKPLLGDVMIELHVPDFDAAKAFYGALGYEVVWQKHRDGDKNYLVMRNKASILNFCYGSDAVYEHDFFGRFDRSTPRGYGVEIILPIDTIEAFYEMFREKFPDNIVKELNHDHSHADFRATDPFGYYLRFVERYNWVEGRDKDGKPLEENT